MPDPKYADRGYLPGPARHDELSDGAPADGAVQASASQERKAGGRGIAPGASLVPAMGGRARKGRSKLTHEVPDALPVSEALKRRARFARRKVCAEWARDVGGGRCGIVASLLAKLGVEDLTMREQAMAEGKTDLARKLGESARMHLLYGREVCAKDAKNAKGASGDVAPWMRLVEVDDAKGGKP